MHGGIVQGVAQALFEEAVYDDDGTLRNPTLMDYLVPSAAELPSFTLDHTTTPSPTNPMGAKGIGEAGTIASTPAVINAVVDALSPYGITDIVMPATPERVWQAIQATARARERRHDPRRLRLRPGRLGRRRHRRARRARRRGQAAGRRPLAAAADEAAAGGAVGARRHRPAVRPVVRARRRRPRRHRRPHPPPRPRDERPARHRGAAAAARGRPGRRPAGAPPRHHRRLDRPRRPGVRPAGGAAGHAGDDRRQGPRRRAHHPGRRLLHRLPRDGAVAHRAAHRDPRAEGGRRRLVVPEAQPARPGLGHRRRGGGAERLHRHRPGEHGLGAAARRGRGGGRRRRRVARPTRPRSPTRAPSRAPTSTPAPSSAATWRGCSCAGRWRSAKRLTRPG